MGVVFLCVIWLITVATTYLFIAKTWWIPTGASTSAVAIDHQVELILRSHDVIHRFFVPQMRFKQDAIPGRAIQLERASVGKAENPYSGGRV